VTKAELAELGKDKLVDQQIDPGTSSVSGHDFSRAEEFANGKGF
jgi:hypothetical protein